MSKTKIVDISGQKIELMKDLVKADDFVFMDPPYYPVTKGKSGKVSIAAMYNGDGFTPVDFLVLKNRCDDYTKNGIAFMLTNSDCEFIRLLFKDYNIIEVVEPRGLRRKGMSTEKCLLITNYTKKEDVMKGVDKLSKVFEKEE